MASRTQKRWGEETLGEFAKVLANILVAAQEKKGTDSGIGVDSAETLLHLVVDTSCPATKHNFNEVETWATDTKTKADELYMDTKVFVRSSAFLVAVENIKSGVTPERLAALRKAYVDMGALRFRAQKDADAIDECNVILMTSSRPSSSCR